MSASMERDAMLREANFETEAPACLCGRTDHDRIRLARDDVTGAMFRYLRCPGCGLERLSPRPVIGAMGRFYPESYEPFSDAAPSGASRADRIKRLVYETYHAEPAERGATVRRWRWALRILLWPLRHHSILSFPPPATRNVFEFGAGSGADLMEFRAAGWRVSGCEPSAVACRVAAGLGIALQRCTAEAAELPEGVSCVYMNNVIEHLHDPHAVLVKARARMTADGLVVLVVPNHASLAARLFGAAWPGYDTPKHIWGYTPRAIRQVMERAGFAVLSIDQKYPFSTYCWWTGISGVRLERPRWPAFRRWLAERMGRLLVVLGMLAAFAGHGDYIRVVAQKAT